MSGLIRILIVIAAASFIVENTAVAQTRVAGSQPNWNADALYQTVRLDGGFMPDPWSYAIQAGGQNLATRLGGNCTGFINNAAPDITLIYGGGSFLDLHVYVNATEDTTLVISGPDGRWHCDDDAMGLNPMLIFEQPDAGQYDIWVGVYGSGDIVPATIYISELNPMD
ncbi:hypothetical protein [Aliidiomarina quisquiliarum]|uniref:hypothetical protein n=1 Tax=Aliidiomarina quisquiliarum TaxID=2938947 RepID=UPI00208DF4CD|nr:hypothetical protein [Aliidiomarina quisquiliarum]MCO4320907.1 hypothetical protein [Aliidiomarina quisquiliarum]